jgi:hypothetical protein
MFAIDLEPTARNRFDNKTGQEEGQRLGLAEKPPMLRPAGQRESNSPERRLCQNCPFHSSACIVLGHHDNQQKQLTGCPSTHNRHRCD